MIRVLRLAQGQALWLCIACHFLNHVVGLTWLGTTLLSGAFGVHVARGAWILRPCFSKSASWPNAPV